MMMKTHKAVLDQWLKANDLRLFLKESPVGQAKSEFQKEAEFRVNNDEFNLAIERNCQLWRQRMKRQSKNYLLDYDGWERLKKAVIDLLPYLQGLSIDEAIKVVSVKVSCNGTLLEGLPKRLKVWKSN